MRFQIVFFKKRVNLVSKIWVHAWLSNGIEDLQQLAHYTEAAAEHDAMAAADALNLVGSLAAADSTARQLALSGAAVATTLHLARRNVVAADAAAAAAVAAAAGSSSVISPPPAGIASVGSSTLHFVHSID